MKLWIKLSIISSAILILTISISGFFIITQTENSLIDKEKELATLELENLVSDFETTVLSEDIIWRWDIRRNSMVKYLFEEVGTTNAILLHRTDNFILYSNYTFAPNEYLPLQYPEDCYFMDYSIYIGEIQGTNYLIIGRIPENTSNASSDTTESTIEDFSLYIVKDMTATYDEIEALTHMYIFISALSILAGLLLIIFSIRHNTKHLKKLNMTTQEIANGNYNQRVTIETKDEIGELGHNMNTMASKIESTIEELTEQIQRQKLFIGAVSHEYKTPLTGLLLHLELLSTIDLDEDSKKDSLVHMENQCHYLEDITRKLTKIITIEKELSIHASPMQAFAMDIQAQVQPLLNEKDISLKIECTAQEMNIDTVLMQIATINMIHNAYKASDNRSVITLRIRPFIIEVEDSGIGIPEAELERIKEPFYVVDKARNKKVSGTGIGLSLVNEIAKLHGGSLSIESQVGVGTIVTIRID
ncbi:MAG: HAMP domain-containing sensor histidine kinase [Eubacteriales bacterium]